MKLKFDYRTSILLSKKYYSIKATIEGAQVESEELEESEFKKFLFTLQDDICSLLDHEDYKEWVKIITPKIERAGLEIITPKEEEEEAI